jgi:cyclase
MNVRIIPCLLLKNQGLVKTIKFGKDTYIGDPINAIRIFNDKEVDELVFLDISATKEKRSPNMPYIQQLASECFMPFAYGGGVTCIDHIKKLNAIGVEKVIINTAAFSDIEFVINAVKEFGSSTIVISLDVKKDFFGKYHIYTHGGSKKYSKPLNEVFEMINHWQVGEVIINAMDRDGTMLGYDETLIKLATDTLDMPVVALGGAGKIEDFRSVIENTSVLAVAAGSMFVFYGPHKAVLINYPTPEQIALINQ